MSIVNPLRNEKEYEQAKAEASALEVATHPGDGVTLKILKLLIEQYEKKKRTSQDRLRDMAERDQPQPKPKPFAPPTEAHEAHTAWSMTITPLPSLAPEITLGKIPKIRPGDVVWLKSDMRKREPWRVHATVERVYQKSKSGWWADCVWISQDEVRKMSTSAHALTRVEDDPHEQTSHATEA